MDTVVAPPIITNADRIGFTICLAIITHAIIVLGVTFVSEDSYQPKFDTMDIILVQQSDNEEPEDAQLLAQANNVGGG